MTIAQRMFDGTDARFELAEKLYEAGFEWQDLGWDHYDCSLEIQGVPPEVRLSPEVQRIVFDAGFAKVYVNHTDKWETHYSWKYGESFAPVKGWRVSYGHRRGDGSKDVWVEEFIEGWPKEWFEAGYVKIVHAQCNSQEGK